jgi:hypothetical protein
MISSAHRLKLLSSGVFDTRLIRCKGIDVRRPLAIRTVSFVTLAHRLRQREARSI